ncbi:hypothetical protein DL96DRAFT_1823865 [Flagelloscypha sp. PMI_526]|nr:hypothetical protein DL96DRAFT_1823865 [Flagelloscypha sp. PMI_526]
MSTATSVDLCISEWTCKSCFFAELPPPQFSTSNGTTPPIALPPAPAAYPLGNFSNHKPNASVSSPGPVVSPSASQCSANSTSSFTHTSIQFNARLFDMKTVPQRVSHPNDLLPNLPPPPRPHCKALALSGTVETDSSPASKLPSPPCSRCEQSQAKREPSALSPFSRPTPKIHFISIGREESVIEEASAPLMKRDTLLPSNIVATTGTDNQTPLWK